MSSEDSRSPDSPSDQAAPAPTEEAATPLATSEAAGADRPKPQERGKQRSLLRELPVLAVIALVLALVLKTWVVQAFFIPSASMEQTLDIGDRVLVNKVVYHFRTPHRGEIVVFNGLDSWDSESEFPQPTNPVSEAARKIGGVFGFAADEKDYIKRVIGVPGDRVACCTDGRMTVNGHELREGSYLYPHNHPSDTPFGPVTVPKGRLWVMGDHRDVSYDSRQHLGDPGGGTIPENRVIGKAFVRVWPASRFHPLSVPGTFRQRGLAEEAKKAAATVALGFRRAAGTPSFT